MKGFFKYGLPMVELIIEGKKVELLLDTGFNGHLMLSSDLINRLNLTEIGTSDYTNASGEGKETSIYSANVELMGRKIEVDVLATDGDFSLVGLEMFNDCKLIIEKHSEILEIFKTK